MRHCSLDLPAKVINFKGVRASVVISHLAKSASKSVHPFGWSFIHWQRDTQTNRFTVMYKIAVARVTVWRSIIDSLYTVFFPLEQLLPLRNFQKNKCVSIDSKCSETHRNARKKCYPLWVVFPLPQNAQILTQSTGPKFQQYHQVWSKPDP